jgi:hypothetical protein
MWTDDIGSVPVIELADPQSPSHATSAHRTLQALDRMVKVGAATRLGLRDVDHRAGIPDQSEQFRLRRALPAADAGANGR